MSDDKKNGKPTTNQSPPRDINDSHLKPDATAPKPINRRQAAQKDSIIFHFQSDLYKLGFEAAIKSGALDPDPDTLSALEGDARASARNAAREPYNPEENPHDKVRNGEFQKRFSDRKQHEQRVEYNRKEVGQREKDASPYVKEKEKPEPSLLQMISATSLFSLSLAPTFHDRFFLVIDDDPLRWFLSLASGVCAGAFVTLSMLKSLDVSGKRTWAHWGGLLAGVVLAVGFALVRLVGVEDNSEKLFAYALAAIEVGVVIYLECYATGLRSRIHEWAAYEATRHDKLTLLEFARQNLRDAEAALDLLNAKIDDHQAYLEDRIVRQVSVAELEETAVRAVRNGYMDGISRNRGKIYGNSEGEES